MIRQQLFIGAALVCGVAIGYFARSSSDAPREAEPAHPHERRAISDRGESASINALRHRIAELEKQLAAAGAAAEDGSAASTNLVAVENRPRGDPQQWLENLKQKDPERYTQMTNRFAQWRLRRNERAQRTMEFLASVDTSRWNDKQRQTHEDLQDMIVRKDELDEQMQSPDLTPIERKQLFDEMRETDKELRQLNNRERRALIEATARAAGLKKNVGQVVNTIQEVIQATDGGGHGFGPPPGGGKGAPPPQR